MAQHVVNITDGSGSENLVAGAYSVTASVTGYGGALDPTSFTATTVVGSEDFTIAATGTLTVIVNETGAEGGTAVTGGTMIRCSSDGNTNYGTSKTINGSGNCTFDHVPYDDGAEPYKFYIKQLTSDDTHNIQTGVITVSMAASAQTDYVQNTPAVEQSFTLTDAYYSGLPITGSLTFDGPQ